MAGQNIDTRRVDMNDIAPVQKTKRRKTGKLRDAILVAAQQVFAERGYAATTREIADRAGTTEPSIYRHFDRKPMLFAEAVFLPLEEALHEQIVQLRAMCDHPLPPPEGMRKYIETILGTVRPNKRLFVTYLNAIMFNGDDFIDFKGISAPPSFQDSLDIFEISSKPRADSSLIVYDHSFEWRLILLFLFAVGLLDELFFGEDDRNQARMVKSMVKLLTMGLGLADDPENRPRDDENNAALVMENQQLRKILVEKVLEIDRLQRGGAGRAP